MEFHSLWLDSPRSSWPQLQSDLDCDVAIVGAGISGVTTLYFLLMFTEKRVALFERHFVASGATGHNAGLPTAHIERPVAELVEEFGFERTKQTFKEIDSGVDLLYEISRVVGFEDELFPISSVGFGFSSPHMLLYWLAEGEFHTQIGREKWVYWALEEVKKQIPPFLHGQVQWVSREQLFSLLKIEDPKCIGITFGPRKRLRMNSALFCDRVLQYLAKRFAGRCFIYEESGISQIDLKEGTQTLHHAFGKVFAKDLILCTNAYTDFSIMDQRTGGEVTKLRETISQKEGYMAAYATPNRESSLVGFTNEGNSIVPYWYLSTAPLSKEESMVCLGGPEYALDLPLTPEKAQELGEESLRYMGQFFKDHRLTHPPISFFWHGTMGYTQSGLRWVGQDPDHSHLWYNLGCNGNGILHALAGGQKIARQMNGEMSAPSLFDPPSS